MTVIKHDEIGFYDFEHDCLYSEDELHRLFDRLKAEDPANYCDIDFDGYIRECTGKNGTLVPVKEWEEVFA